MNAILDTGPWVALIDRSESNHDACVEWLRGYHGNLYSTEAVLTEVLYLLSFSSKAQAAAIDFVLESAVEIVPPSIESLRTSRRLIEKHADLPMDYADATIVGLAMESGISTVVTLDRKDFSIYRIKSRPFTIIP